jgi:hypothetical protein
MARNGPAATDLGALLRESINTGLSAAQSGRMPVQLAPPPSARSYVPPPPASYVPPPPMSTARPVAVDARLSVAPANAPAKSSGIVGILLCTMVLASAMASGAVWYVQYHQAKVAAAIAAQAPPAAKDAPPAAEAVPAPEAKAREASGTEPKVEKTESSEKATEKVRITEKPTKRAHRAAKVEKPSVARPVAKGEKVEKTEKTEKTEKAVVEAPPPPKPAGGAVDAVLQQQLSGAL